MSELVEETWQRRREFSPFRESVSFCGDDLVFGLDTVLYPLGVGDSGTISLRPDAAHDRMVALLAVAGHGRLAKAGLAQLTTALDDWRRGDRGLAAIRLAFAPLPRLHGRDDAYRLVLAETALDADVSPAALLEELGYLHCTPLLKFDPNQPRVPAGSGAPSGRWTSGAGGGATGTVSGPSSREPHGDAGSLRPTPVLFSETPEDRARTSPDAEWQRLDIGGDEKLRIEDGRPLLPPTIAPGAPTAPGTPAVSAPRATLPEAGRPSLATPSPAMGPTPQLAPAPVGAPPAFPDPAPSTRASRDDKGLACPAPQDDRPNGPSPSGDEFEYMMSLLINPRNPTPKYSMATPNVISQAYYLPSPTPDGKTSFDDCKKDDTPTLLPIPDLKRGAMFEHKAAGWGWQLSAEGSAGYQQFDKQIRNQNDAVILEGRGRQIYYCLGEQRFVTKAQDIFGHRYPSSHFYVCH